MPHKFAWVRSQGYGYGRGHTEPAYALCSCGETVNLVHRTDAPGALAAHVRAVKARVAKIHAQVAMPPTPLLPGVVPGRQPRFA